MQGAHNERKQSIESAVETLEGIARDLMDGILFHEGDVEATDYADEMLRKPAVLARALSARGEFSDAEAIVRRYADLVATDLKEEVLVVRSDDFDAEGYRNIVLGGILEQKM